MYFVPEDHTKNFRKLKKKKIQMTPNSSLIIFVPDDSQSTLHTDCTQWYISLQGIEYNIIIGLPKGE